MEEAAVERQLEAFRERIGSQERFAQALQQMGLTEASLKAKIRENLAIRKLISQAVEPGVTVSDEEARSFYEQNRSAFQQPEKTMSFEEVEAEFSGVLRRERSRWRRKSTSRTSGKPRTSIVSK